MFVQLFNQYGCKQTLLIILFFERDKENYITMIKMAVLTFNTSRKSSFYPAVTYRKLLLIEFSVSAFAALFVIGFLEKLKRRKILLR